MREEHRELVARIRHVLGPDGLLGPEEVAQRATSFWDAAPMRALSLARPENTAQVSAVLALCHAASQPVTVCGGLTGAVAGSVPSPETLVLSLERMCAVESVDGIEGSCIVQAGVTLQTVQELAEAHGLLFPLDLGARGSCTIGGNIATNAGGINVMRYGMMRGLVLGLEAVLADGTVLTSLGTMLKNNAGYDLKQLFIGSEGTLGVVTRAALRLFPRPRTRNTALVATDDFSKVADLLSVLKSQLGPGLCAFEVMWGSYVRHQVEHGGHTSPIDPAQAYYVVVETQGSDAARDDAAFTEALERAFDAGLVGDAVVARSERERSAIWRLREDFSSVLRAHTVYGYDVSLPIRHMDTYVRRVDAGLQRRWPGSRCMALGHIADGNVHFFVLPDREGTTQEESDEEVYGPLAAVGGAVSAEHGIGTEKKAWLARTRSAEEMNLMRALKRTLDPRAILNPGCVFDAA
jgi:FAD/FMN-containing dehydrogenase